MVTYTKGFNIHYIIVLKNKLKTYTCLDDWKIILVKKVGWQNHQKEKKNAPGAIIHLWTGVFIFCFNKNIVYLVTFESLWAKEKHTSFGIFLKSSFRVGPLKWSILKNSPRHICYVYLQFVCDGYYIFLS